MRKIDDIKPLTIKTLRNIYYKYNIKKKKLFKRPYNPTKYDDSAMLELL